MSSDRAEVGAGVENEDLSGQTVLVTGATDGIGRETALALGRLGAHVLVHGRNPEKGEELLDALDETHADGADRYLADFATQEAVHDLSGEIVGEYDRLDCLVNNAGGLFTDGRLTDDGIEQTFAVNHLAPFSLTTDLYPLLENAGGRVVIVSSDAHRGASMKFERLRTVESYSGWAAYSRSKLANVLFTYELANRSEAITANCLHPGAVPGSEFGRDLPAPIRAGLSLLEAVPTSFSGPFVESVVEGAQTPVYLAASPEVTNTTGEYFENCEWARSSSASHDERTQRRLWNVSVELSGVDLDAP
jgi:NAD(P)-dependent dehydrogenase (short-subunit alcohol dehydrogenase family)